MSETLTRLLDKIDERCRALRKHLQKFLEWEAGLEEDERPQTDIPMGDFGSVPGYSEDFPEESYDVIVRHVNALSDLWELAGLGPRAASWDCVVGALDSQESYASRGVLLLAYEFVVQAMAAVHRRREHVAGAADVRQSPTPQKASPNPEQTDDGEWSQPMTKAAMSRRLALKRDAFETFAGGHGLRQCGSRQLWQIRLDKMDANTRHRIERGRPLKQ